MSLFPNPTSAAVRINGLTGATAIELIDAMGRVVLTTSLLPDQNTVDMHSLPAGTYILRLMDAEGVKVARVVRN
ncbi:MAG: T9SS type A sorting domain-containing protein [Flavobacteriales bacterium]|nr:T9SS type A sorting domain-containing protein [Flavobacteriales bacterium]